MFYLSTYKIRFSPIHLLCCNYVVQCTYLIYSDLPMVHTGNDADAANDDDDTL